MDFDYLIESLNPDPLVQKKKKYATFTVKEIGGPAEIIKWRQAQEAKEHLYRMKLNERESRLASFEAETNQRLESPKIHTTSWSEKVAFAKSERERLSKAESVVTQYPAWEVEPTPKLSIFQKITGLFKSLWKNANF